jgi:hypothetical protein
LSAPTGTFIPCVRCGAFVPAENAITSVVSVCGACSSNLRVGKNPYLNFPPAYILQRRALALSLIFSALGCLAVIAWTSTPAPRQEAMVLAARFVFPGPLQVAVVGVALLLVMFLPVLFTLAWLPGSNPRWKRATLDALGLSDELGRHFVHCVYCSQAPRMLDVRNPVEVGLMLHGPGGVAFLGQDQRRLLIPAAEIIWMRVEGLTWLWPPRKALAVRSTRGLHYFAVIEGATRRQHLERMQEAMTQLNRSERG